METEYKIGQVLKIKRGDKKGTATVRSVADGMLKLEMSPGLLQLEKVHKVPYVTDVFALSPAEQVAYFAGFSWAKRLRGDRAYPPTSTPTSGVSVYGQAEKKGQVIVRGAAT